MWLKIWSAQTLWFCNSHFTTFPTTRKCKNFNISLYTVLAKMPYLQKYLTNFKKLLFSWKMRKVAIVVKIWSAPTFWFCNSNVTIFPFPLSKQKCHIFKSIERIFKPLLWLKDEERGSCGWKLEVRRHFSFAIATLQLFPHPENVEISISALHCPGRNAISSKVFNEFSKTSFLLKDEERDYCARKFEMHRHFSFAIATLQLFQHPEHVKISTFPIKLSQQKCYIFKSI